MEYRATDPPDLSNVSKMISMFRGASSFNGDISAWNVSKVTNMFSMFEGASSFDRSLNNWNVSKVTGMSFMFNGASLFNQSLNEWDVSKVTYMAGMFQNTYSFDRPLNEWDVSKVTDMSFMFNAAGVFNGEISDWDVSSVTDMANMFYDAASFNGEISTWNVSGVKTMSSMFSGATAFDQNLGEWYVIPADTAYDVSEGTLSVTTISAQNAALDGHNPNYGIGSSDDSDLFNMTGNVLMFKATPSAGNYTVDVTAPGGDFGTNNHRVLDVTVTDKDAVPEGAFVTTWNATSSPHTISIPLEVYPGGTITIDWGDGSTADVTANGTQPHTYSGPGDYQVSMTGNLSRIEMSATGGTESKLASIDQWGDIRWSSMERAFEFASNMEYAAIDAPDLSGVSSMNRMFHFTSSFNGDLSRWNVSSVTDMSGVFLQASSFNRDLSTWDVSSVTQMISMFDSATVFNWPLHNWNVSSVNNMQYMFNGAVAFNSTLNDWNVSSVNNMNSMFRSAASFNQPLHNWNVSSVNNMQYMFNGAAAFNSTLNDWNVSSVTDMHSMFLGATVFNQPLNDWDVLKVTDMSFMFNDASSFNGDISAWNVSSATSMTSMFLGATAFDQNLGAWYVVPDSTEIARAGIPGIVGVISAQNSYLDDQIPVYSIEEDDDFALFEIVNGNKLNMTSVETKSEYAVNVTASGSDVFESGNNWRTFEVTVTGQGNRPPVVTAGDSAYAYEGSVGRLEGTASDLDGDPLTHEWTHDGAQSLGITIANDTALSTTFAVAGDVASDTAVTFTLTVSDGTSSPVLATVDVTVRDSSGAFITTWETDDPQTVVIFIVEGTDLIIDWGDGTVGTVSSGLALHTYAEAGQYRIIADGSVSRLYHTDGFTTPQLLRYVDQWGDINWFDMQSMFVEASNMEYRATYIPDLSNVSSMNSMFDGASSFNGDISAWNVSKVTNMQSMFHGASLFNQSLNEWDVSKVIHMPSMFQNALRFNQSLNEWDVSKVTDMSHMFFDAASFDGEISDWDVSKVIHMPSMFQSASLFNQPLSNWNVSQVADMTDMFHNADAFDQNLGAWYVVPDGTEIARADIPGIVGVISAQNSYLDDQIPVYSIEEDDDSAFFEIVNGNKLNMTSVETKSEYAVNVTASGGTVFEDGNNWRTFEVTVTGQGNRPPVVTAGDSAYAYEGSVGRLEGTASDLDGDPLTHEWTHDGAQSLGITIANDTALSTTFAVAGDVASDTAVTFTLTVSDGTSSPVLATVDVTVRDSSGAFIATWKTGAAQTDVKFVVTGTDPIIDWGDGTVGTVIPGLTSHTYAEAGQYRIIADGSVSRLYHVDGLTTPQLLMYVDQWGDINWSDMEDMFHGASNMKYRATNTPDLSNVSKMISMFDGASSFNGNISAWNVSKVTNMISMFDGASSFNGNISAWNVSKVIDMFSMFRNAASFDQSLNDWNVSKVTDMSFMFNHAASFDQSLNDWNVSKVTNMDSMFSDTDFFNSDISSWNTSAVTDMSNMFSYTNSFNGNISSWNTSAVTDMSNMFFNAASFNGEISTWNVSGVLSMDGMFDGAAAFVQNLGEWYVIPADMAYDVSEGTLNVTTISAQNTALDEHNPNYGIGSSGASDLFRMTGNVLMFKATPSAGIYTVDVTAPGGDFGTGNHRILDVTVTGSANNADLDDLTISSGTLSPAFSSSEITYTASVNNSVTQVTITPTASHSSATITVNGNTATSGTGYTVTGLTVGANTLTVIVTAQDSTTTKTYTVTLTRIAAPLSNNADLDDLTISSGTLSPAFSSSEITYTASVNNSVTQVTITPTASHSSATITVNGNTATSGTGYTVTGLTVGANTLTVIVTAQDSTTTKTYTVTLTRIAAPLSNNADLDDLTISSGTLSPAFSSSEITYTASVNNSVTQVTITPTASHSSATITVNGNTATSGTGYTVTGLTVGANTLTVIVTAQDSTTTKTYIITVTVRDVPITVSSATYNPGNGQLTITFNQDIATVDYSGLHVRSSANLDTGGIMLSNVTGADYSGRTITATLDSEQQDRYDALQSPHLVVEDGAVTDTDGDRTTDVPPQPIRDASQKRSSSSKAPLVNMIALVQARIVDIPPHIAEQVASRDDSDPLEPLMLDGTFDFPLAINGYGYLLDDVTNTLVPQIVTVGDDGPTVITFTVYTQKDLAHFTLYLNLSDENTDYADSDTYITYKDDGTTSVTDPHGYISGATITVTQEDDSVPEKKTVRVTVEFGEEPMGPTNMVAYTWNADRKAVFVKVIDALEVVAAPQEPVIQAADPEPLEPGSVLPADPEPVLPDFADDDDAADSEPVPADALWPADDYDEAQVLTLIRMWSGFESEMITDTQLLELLGLEGYQDVDLPDWMMTELGVLAAKGDVTVDEFMLALQYVLEHA